MNNINNNNNSTTTASASQSSIFEGFPFPHSANAQPTKLDAQTPFFFSPGATGYPLESPTNMQQWYFNSTGASPAFNFDSALPSSPYFQPLPSHQQPQQSSSQQADLDTSTASYQQQLLLQQQQARSFYQIQQQLAYQQIPLQPPTFQLQQPSSSNPQYSQTLQQQQQQQQQQYRNYSNSNLPLNQNNLASTSTSRSYPPASSVPPSLINDDASLTYSSDSSAASSTFGAGIRQVAATGRPLCVDLKSLEEDGRKGGRGSAVEAKVEDEDDGSFEIPGFKAGAGGDVATRTSRRKVRNPVKYQEDEEEDEDENSQDLQSDDDEDASDSPSSSSSTTSSYHEGRRPSNTSTSNNNNNNNNTASSSSKPKPKSTKPPAPSAKANSSSSSNTSATKRRVSAPEPSSSTNRHLSSSPPLPLKRVKLSPSISSSSSPTDFLSLPPLPEDFDQYGEGGQSRFLGDEHHGSGGVAIPDFSGREDCWGIGKEAYQKLSAKAKKQLRNKLGARRFRERRKEYITTLEERIAGRDGLITETRSRLVRSIDLVKELQAKVGALERTSSSS